MKESFLSDREGEIEWDDGQGLEDLRAWGTESIRVLVNAIQNDFECDTPKGEKFIIPLSYLIEDKLDEIDSTIGRFVAALKELDKRKKKKE